VYTYMHCGRRGELRKLTETRKIPKSTPAQRYSMSSNLAPIDQAQWHIYHWAIWAMNALWAVDQKCSR